MRYFTGDFQEHIESGSTTLCWCWQIIRADGEVMGFTDLDRSILFLGLIHEPQSGFTSSQAEQNLQLNVDSIEVDGYLESDSITETDIANGVYDNATVRLFRVNYEDVNVFTLWSESQINAVSTSGINFVFELTGLSQQMQQKTGRMYMRRCDATLGDSRCGVSLVGSTNRGTGAVTSVSGLRYTVSGIDSYADGWFTNGRVHYTVSGTPDGRVHNVKSHTKQGSVVTIEVWNILENKPEAGDEFYITAGCDKTIEMCHAKFSNRNNHRGFPLMPNNDAVSGYPDQGASINNGGSRFNR